VLYQENDWVYVISEDSREGFIPHSYTAQFGSQVQFLSDENIAMSKTVHSQIIFNY
jgi:hypothetical protein